MLFMVFRASFVLSRNLCGDSSQGRRSPQVTVLSWLSGIPGGIPGEDVLPVLALTPWVRLPCEAAVNDPAEVSGGRSFTLLGKCQKPQLPGPAVIVR